MATSEALNQFENILSFTWHPIATKYTHSEAQVRGIFKGNQGGATTASMNDAVLRLLGIHPVAKRNVLEKPIRCVSKVLPQSDDDEENQQFVEFKRLFPRDLIKKGVNARNPRVIVRDAKGGKDKIIEFLSSSQEIDAFMSVQRSAYYQDEEIDRDKWNESKMRLLRHGGDITICLTPVKGLDWTYDDIWMKAHRVYRSKTICDKFGLPEVEERPNNYDIECFCWATDDNPVLEPGTIDNIFDGITEEEELAMRRYGVFRQISGRIYKVFDQRVHVISKEQNWDEQRFRSYWHYRIIDYHPTKPWYISWVAISPENEWFVWREWKASHDHVTTFDLRDGIRRRSLVEEEDAMNRKTLVDPLSKVKQPNSGFSVFEDLGRGPDGLRRLQEADTKNEQARMNIKKRLSNSLLCGAPRNNLIRHLPEDVSQDHRFGNHLPTLWFFDDCREHINHFLNWRTIEYRQEKTKNEKDEKKIMQRWSDFCRNLEFLGALNPVYMEDRPQVEYHQPFFMKNNPIYQKEGRV